MIQTHRTWHCINRYISLNIQKQNTNYDLYITETNKFYLQGQVDGNIGLEYLYLLWQL